MLGKILIFAAVSAAVAILAVCGFVLLAVQTLPSASALAKYEPPVTTRVHAGDGSLIAEFAREQRVFVPIGSIPDTLKHAFLSAEDKSFYEHGGIDTQGILKAMAGNVVNVIRGKRLRGASTITQQVAKNMLLTSDRTIMRKVKEIFLAQRIDKAFSKDRVLELYLNEIYLGDRSYGVASAALNYFNKPLDQLTLSESAFLGALPKAPNNYSPTTHKAAALARRNWVLSRMAANGYITDAQAAAASKDDLKTTDRLSGASYIASAHFVEELRREMIGLYGEKALYDGGLSIRSSVDPHLQVAAAAALRKGLDQYDRRHGWRGPLQEIDPSADIARLLRKVTPPPGASGWRIAMVSVAGKTVALRFADGGAGELSADDVKWAAAGARSEKKRALKPGAVIYVELLKSGKYALRQVPAVEGALLAMDPHTGRVLAMVGGYSFADSQYNRVTQAKRQPGSAFKPIVYAAALDYGLTPATLIDDAPFQMKAGDGSMWSPENYEKDFLGPTTLRTGLEESRNTMTVRLAYTMGMEKVVDYAKKLGVNDNLMPVLAMSLGAGETTLTRLTTAYAIFVNGGKRVSPTLVDRVQDRMGKTVYRHDNRPCEGCNGPWRGDTTPPAPPDTREQALDPITSYQVVSILEGVVQRGTGGVAKTIGKPVGGKTGTTSDYKDAWFVGFSPDLVAGVWVGFDKPKNLGNGESGGRLAAPIFRDFMTEALKDTPATPFRIPPGVRLVKVDLKTGLLPGPTTTQTILEAFRPGTEPTRDMEASPFVFGQGETFDPRALSGVVGVDERAAPPPMDTAAPQAKAQEGLGGLY